MFPVPASGVAVLRPPAAAVCASAAELASASHTAPGVSAAALDPWTASQMEGLLARKLSDGILCKSVPVEAVSDNT